MTKLGCGNCHRGVSSSQIVMEQAPELSFAGVQDNPAYLFDYLRKPVRVRHHISSTRMLDFHFDEKESLALTLFLEQQHELPALRGSPEFGDYSETVLHEDDILTLIVDRLQCIGYHLLGGKGLNKSTNLSEVSYRLKPNWVRLYLVNPAAFDGHGTDMPNFFYQSDEGTSTLQEILPDAKNKIEKITGFLSSLNVEKHINLEEAYEHAKKQYPTNATKFPSIKTRQTTQKSNVRFEDFMGSEVCAKCHLEEYDLWKNSTHGMAGSNPTDEFIISSFDGQSLHFADGVVAPSRGQDGGFYFVVEQQDFPAVKFKVDGVVGRGHMYGGGTQTYFSLFPDGTMRMLPFDFIRKEKVWFCETNNNQGWIPITNKLSMMELSEWPPNRILGTEPTFTNCQQCHGSQIQTQYDYSKKRFETRYKSLSINCESCHGPGREHVEIMNLGDEQVTADIGIRLLSTLSKEESLNICFQCHALKDVLQPDYLPGKDLEKYYSLKFPMLGENPFHPDGRIRAFGYQLNHLLSDCYINGSMTCVDCHEPHGKAYRDIQGNPLQGKFDNGQCTGCHAGKVADLKRHTFHLKDSPGSQCTACHMPFFQHKALGKALRFARSDHTISIPRPKFDAELGLDNACQQCHQDKTATQLQEIVEEWYGAIKPHKFLVTGLIRAETLRDRTRVAELVLGDADEPTIMLFAGLSYFLERYLRPDMEFLEPEVIGHLKVLCNSNDIDVKSLALASLHLSLGRRRGIHLYLLEHLNLMGEEEGKIRDRWALVLAYLSNVYRERDNLGYAIKTYRKSLDIKPDDPATLLNLGLTYEEYGQHSKAITTYKQALNVKPNDWVVWLNLGIAYGADGKTQLARDAYAKSVEINPHYALGHFNLGNFFYTSGDFTGAIKHYSRSVKIDPALALGYFYLARSYIMIRQYRQAFQAVQSGLRIDPQNQSANLMLNDLKAFLGID